MLLKVACVLSLLPAPQDPAAQAPTATSGRESAGAEEPSRLIARHARRLPASTLALITVPSIRENYAALGKTGLGEIRKHIAWPPRAPSATAAVAAIAQAAGVTPERIWDAALGNASLALLDGEGGDPDFLATLEIGDLAAKLARLHESVPSRLAAQAIGLRAEAVDDRAIWTLGAGEEKQLAITFVAGHLLASNSRARLLTSLQEWQGENTSANSSLAHDDEFRSFLAHTPTAPGPIVAAGFVHTTAIRQLLERGIPGADPTDLDDAKTMLKAIGLDQLTGAGFNITAHGPDLVEDWFVGVPEPRKGLLGAMVGSTATIGKDLATLVPDRCQGYTVGSLDLPGLWRGITSAIHTASPEVGSQVQSGLRMLRTRTGLDLDSDLLAHLGRRVAVMGWGRVDSSGDSSDFALLIELTDANALDQTIARLVQRSRLPLRRRTLYGRKAYQFVSPSGRADRVPGLATTKNWLILASDERPMTEVLEQLRKPRQNVGAMQHFAKLPANTVWTSRSDIRDLLGRLNIAAKKADQSQGNGSRRGEILERILANAEGPLRFCLTADAKVINSRFASPYGNGLTVSVALAAMAGMFPDWGEGILGEAPDTRVDVLASWSNYMRFLGQKQVEFRTQNILDRDRDETGEFGSFGQLIASGALAAETLGQRQTDNSWVRDGYRFQILLPDDTDQREQQFALVAWPDASRTGPVFYCGPDGKPRINEVIAGALGLTELTAADLFGDRAFGGELTAGWRTIDSEQETEATSPEAPTNSSSELLVAIEAAEAQPEQRPSQAVIDALEAADPALVARAAHALGKAGAKEATTRLIQLAQNTNADPASTNVRIQAMGALLRLADPRATSVAIERLNDPSRTVRALAASTLGRLKAPTAVDPLITLLSRETDQPGSTDRLAALDALTDLKPVQALLATATAVSNENEDEGKALAYLFQAGSPNLADQEPKVLMAVLDHPNTLLRRYAIQRLGELGDRTTADALEGRLGVENELRPLVETSLNAVRGLRSSAQQQGAFDGVLARWNEMSETTRMTALGGAGAGLLGLIAFVFWRRRSRHRREAEAWAAMAAPSEDGYDEQYEGEQYEGEADGDYEGAEYDGYAQGDYAEATDEQGTYEETNEFSGDVLADSGEYEEFQQGDEAEAWDEEWSAEGELEDTVASDDDTYPYDR